ncbi:MAG: rod shape-determining protein RodA [Bacteroidetes bacterium CG12_big_fil_rev_8_21_14_0_65_60_17]|nr:MAG: rod shape-determining protein RodA [Bacteroidetes bacterium CG12_big_fil_rev_8_21_14_0_65_60_17]
MAGCTAADAPKPDTAPPPAPVEDSPPPNTSPEGAMSYIISPEDGAVVSAPVTVRFGLKGMGVAPAGIQTENTGHHHLMIDVDELPDLTAPLPADDNHIHFGLGQTETVLELSPGTHTLQLILGNWAHTPHAPPVVSEKVTITVQ